MNWCGNKCESCTPKPLRITSRLSARPSPSVSLRKAISVPCERQTASETLAIKAEAYGMPGVRVDGNDVLAVYGACKEAVTRARKGQGPTLIETVTYRMASHSSSDDAARYRDAKIYDSWKQKDPIVRFQRFLALAIDQKHNAALALVGFEVRRNG